MEHNILDAHRLQDLRARGLITENEVVYVEGDLYVAKNVLTGDKRIITDSSLKLETSAGPRRVLKG